MTKKVEKSEESKKEIPINEAERIIKRMLEKENMPLKYSKS